MNRDHKAQHMHQEPVLHDYRFTFICHHHTVLVSGREIVVVDIKKQRNWEIIGIEKEYIRDRPPRSCNSRV